MRQLPLLLIAALAPTFAEPAAAAMIDELSPADQAKLQAGQNIVTTIDKPGATWPEVRIYRKVKATPQGLTDLFLDYENASSFIDNLESAVVENQPDAQTKDVRYNVRLPVLLSISYLVRNHYQKTSSGYIIRWNLLESVFAKSADGSLRVEPHSDGSIICYTNHVEPATKLVAGLRGQAIKQANTTVDSIAREAERRQRTQKR